MKTILNVIWLVLSGFWLFLGYLAAGLVLCITIIGIPFGLASFRIGLYALWPFGRTVVDKPGAGAASCVGNVLWLAAVVLWLSLMLRTWLGETWRVPLAGDLAAKIAASNFTL